MADRAVIAQLSGEGKVVQHGPPAHSWLGVPLFQGDDVQGVVVVQSYSPEVKFTQHDQSLLNFVAHNIGNGPTLEDMLFEFPITGHYRYGGPR